MPQSPRTDTSSYTERLISLGQKPWKTLLNVQYIYHWNIKRLRPGVTLDIGCGVGRYLQHLPNGSVGIDHNQHSIRHLPRGLIGYLPKDFKKSVHYKPGSFDSLLLSHVLEHMKPGEAIKLINTYRPLLKENGKLIICCPQEKGYASDNTHVTFLDSAALAKIATDSGFAVNKSYSFPLPRRWGKLFTYNEFIVVGLKAT